MWNILLDVYIHDFHEVKTVFLGKEFSMPTNTAHTEKKKEYKNIYCIIIFKHPIADFNQMSYCDQKSPKG